MNSGAENEFVLEISTSSKIREDIFNLRIVDWIHWTYLHRIPNKRRYYLQMPDFGPAPVDVHSTCTILATEASFGGEEVLRFWRFNGRSDKRLHVHFYGNATHDQGCKYPDVTSAAAATVVVSGKFATFGCSYVDGFEWKGCFLWRNERDLIDMNLARKCESRLKNRTLSLLFL